MNLFCLSLLLLVSLPVQGINEFKLFKKTKSSDLPEIEEIVNDVYKRNPLLEQNLHLADNKQLEFYVKQIAKNIEAYNYSPSTSSYSYSENKNMIRAILQADRDKAKKQWTLSAEQNAQAYNKEDDEPLSDTSLLSLVNEELERYNNFITKYQTWKNNLAKVTEENIEIKTQLQQELQQAFQDELDYREVMATNQLGKLPKKDDAELIEKLNFLIHEPEISIPELEKLLSLLKTLVDESRTVVTFLSDKVNPESIENLEQLQKFSAVSKIIKKIDKDKREIFEYQKPLNMDEKRIYDALCALTALEMFSNNKYTNDEDIQNRLEIIKSEPEWSENIIENIFSPAEKEDVNNLEDWHKSLVNLIIKLKLIIAAPSLWEDTLKQLIAKFPNPKSKER